MNHESTLPKKQKGLLIGIIVSMILFQFVISPLLGTSKDSEMISNSVLRMLGGSGFIILLLGFGYRKIFHFKHAGQALIIMIPAFLISLNNFPIIAFLGGRAQLIDPIYRVFLFFIECLSVGFFEEIIFRGLLLMLLIERLSTKKHGIWIAVISSSILFGMIHLINLINGASLSGTLLQVIYSTLMGMLWAVMYLRTKNLWLTMVLHATYNFFGQVMFYLGTVNNRFDTYTVSIMIILGCLVAVYAFITLKEVIDRKNMTTS